MAQHPVRRGDSLWSIADAHGISVEALRRANPGVSETLQPGTALQLPGAVDVAPSRDDGRQRAATGAVTATATSPSLPKPGAPAQKSSSLRLDSTMLALCAPKGAGDATVRGERLKVSGVAASEALAERDRERVEKLAARFVEAGKKHRVSAALLAAIASRESEVGRLLRRADGWGDDGKDFGIMQVNKVHKPKGRSDPASAAHIGQAAGILREVAAEVRARHPTWTEAEVLRGAVAGYNMGPGNVRTLARLDEGTTHDDYSSDVLARAQYYAREVAALR